MLKRLFKSPVFLILETLILVGLPLFLVLASPSLLPYRLFVMASSFPYIYVIMRVNNITLRTIGVTSLHLFESIRNSIFPVLIVSILMLIADYYFPVLFDYKEIVQESYGIPPTLIIPLYILISVPLQEFILRGFYIRRLELVSKSSFFVIGYSSAVFAIMHAAFQNKLVVLPSFLFSVVIGYYFIKYRSLAAPIFIHAVIGAVFMWLVLN